MKKLLFFVACGLFSTVLVLTATAEDQRPNVLFIAVDDMRAELGCYGDPHIQSPSIDELSREGMLFERAYCQQAVCNPSRASILTGLRPSTLGIWDLPTHFRMRDPDLVTLPQYFKQNGYFTQNIGKIFHNWAQDDFKGDPLSWSVPAEMHYASHGQDVAVVDGGIPPDQIQTPRCEMRDVPDEAYFDGRIAKRAIEVLQERHQQDLPFFLGVGFWKPHAHFNAPAKYWDLYPAESIQPPHPDAAPINVPEIALHDSREILRAYKNSPGQKPNAEQVLTMRRGYYAAISYVDAQIGKVLTELKRLELEDKTIVVLWSDHGYHLGEHNLWAKTSNFELDARVPLIISAPGCQQNRRSQEIVELLDLYPTLVDLCKLPVRNNLEGRSLKPLLQGMKSETPAYAITQHPRPAYPAKGQDPNAMGYSIRSDRFRYTEWRNFGSTEILARELYDHREDPWETINRVNDPQFRQEIHFLAAQLNSQLQTKIEIP